MRPGFRSHPSVFMPLCAAAVGLGALLLSLSGCGGGVKAPDNAGGSPVAILLLFDANIDEGANEQTRADHRQVARWMEADLIRRFEEGGYAVTAGQDPKSFEPGQGRFMLTVRIAEYVSASATPREEAGLGAGTTIIDVYAELFKDNRTIPRYRMKRGNATAMKWEICAEAVTEQTAEEISKAINDLY